jgi:hypothetical protein
MVVTHSIGVLAAGVAVTVMYYKVGLPRAYAGLAFLGICGFGGLGPMIFKKDPGPVQADERDHLINLKAARGSFALSYLVFGILCMGIWEYCRHHDTSVISIEVLPMIWGLAAITVFFSHAIIILVLYGRSE